jgi:hypothetical protein
MIKDGDTEYIYDPTNPTAILDEESQTKRGVPTLYKPVKDLSDLPLDKKVFVKARNITSQKIAFFGVDDGTNILPKHLINEDIDS